MCRLWLLLLLAWLSVATVWGATLDLELEDATQTQDEINELQQQHTQTNTNQPNTIQQQAAMDFALLETTLLPKAKLDVSTAPLDSALDTVAAELDSLFKSKASIEAEQHAKQMAAMKAELEAKEKAAAEAKADADAEAEGKIADKQELEAQIQAEAEIEAEEAAKKKQEAFTGYSVPGLTPAHVAQTAPKPLFPESHPKDMSAMETRAHSTSKSQSIWAMPAPRAHAPPPLAGHVPFGFAAPAPVAQAAPAPVNPLFAALGLTPPAAPGPAPVAAAAQPDITTATLLMSMLEQQQQQQQTNSMINKLKMLIAASQLKQQQAAAAAAQARSAQAAWSPFNYGQPLMVPPQAAAPSPAGSVVADPRGAYNANLAPFQVGRQMPGSLNLSPSYPSYIPTAQQAVGVEQEQPNPFTEAGLTV